jgi:hypothetical protein
MIVIIDRDGQILKLKRKIGVLEIIHEHPPIQASQVKIPNWYSVN